MLSFRLLASQGCRASSASRQRQAEMRVKRHRLSSSVPCYFSVAEARHHAWPLQLIEDHAWSLQLTEDHAWPSQLTEHHA